MNFAVIESGVVTNIIVADSLDIAQEVTGQTCVEYPDGTLVYIGGPYDATTNTFGAPTASASSN